MAGNDYSDLAVAAPVAAPAVSGKIHSDYSDLAAPAETPGDVAPSTSSYPVQVRTVFLPDKNVTFGYPADMPQEDAQAAIREKAYGIPINVPSYIRDQAGVTAPPPEPAAPGAAAGAVPAEPRTPTVAESLLYPPARLFSEAVEKPAWAITNLALRGANGVYKFADTLSQDHALAQDMANHTPGWLDRAVDYTSSPEQNADLTHEVTQMRGEIRALDYHRNYLLGLAGDVAENVTDFVGFMLPISLEEKFAQAGPELLKNTSFLNEFAKNTTKLAGYAFMRSNGKVTERGKAALGMISYNMTPYIANATGATGLGAAAIAAGLNSVVSTPTYVKAFNEAGGVNREFAAMIIPQAVMDIAFAWHTRGLPENQQRAKFEGYFKKRAKEMKLPAEEAKDLMNRLWAELKKSPTQKAGEAMDPDFNLSELEKRDRARNQPLNPDAENEYVKNEPIQMTLGKNAKKTSNNLRIEYAGVKNAQIIRGIQLAEAIRRLVPSATEREALFWFKAAEGDTNVIIASMHDPMFEPYLKSMEAALHLSPNALKALDMMNRFYEEAGRVSKEIGTIEEVRDNYQARLYVSRKPQGTIKNEPSSGLKQTTPHSMERKFETEFSAVEAGLKFSTTDAADILSLYNEEMARVNSARKLADLLVEKKTASWSNANKVKVGWKQVGNLKKTSTMLDREGNPIIVQHYLVAPEGIANGLKAIADPNYTRQIDVLGNVQKYQGVVKTVNLAFSFFHHITMTAQTLYQGGFRTLMHLPHMEQLLESAPFGELEQDFARHGGMTSKVQANQDIMQHLTADNGDVFSKVVNLPGPKQILDGANKSGEFLFGHVQRFMKVTDYGQKMSDWVADHPTATNEQVKAAKQGFAKEVNAAYGGLNWEAMGMTKSNLSLLRLGLLAPDWTLSNFALLKYAVSDAGTAGKASRAHLLTALIGGMALTEGLNKILTGHFTDQNKGGHKLEVEVQPDVYVSFFRGGVGDISNAASMVTESGLSGATRFLSGKLAPFPRTAISLLKNVDYTGAPIAKKGEGAIASSYDVLKFILQSAGPIPFGVANFFRYIQHEEKTLLGGLATSTGVGRFSISGSRANSKRRL